MEFNKILLLQQNKIGDVVLSTGVIKAIRNRFPRSKIAFLASPETVDIVKLDFIDEIIPYTKGHPVLPVLRKIWRYDIAICLDFKYRSAVLPFLARIPIRLGIAHKRKLFLSKPVILPENDEEVYFADGLAAIIDKAIGLKLNNVSKLYVAEATETDKKNINLIMEKGNMPPDCLKIAIAPFSSETVKDWPAASYKEFMNYFTDNDNVRYIILGGKADIAKDFPINENVLDLRGKLKLTETAEILRRADYFIGSCSAPLHMATAVELPTLAFYGPTSPQKWAPQNKCIALLHKENCAPCDKVGYGKYCSRQGTCMQKITVPEAIAAFEALMKKYPK